MRIVGEFKEFVIRGNVVDMAVGIVIGAAFGAIAKSLVDDMIMPPIGLLLGEVEFVNLFHVLREGAPAGPYATLEAAREAGAVVLAWGSFVNTIVIFLIVAFAIFLLIKAINRLRRSQETVPTMKKCPECLSDVPVAATRCAFCTTAIAA